MKDRTNYAQIDEWAGQLAFSFSYNPGLIAALKATVPGTDRTWDEQNKTWLVTHEHGEALQNLCEQYLGVRPNLLVQPTTAPQQAQIVILDVRYVGRVKSRPDGTESAYGWRDDGWNVIFSGDVLKTFFGVDPTRPDEAATLYAVLGVNRAADSTAIKKAYRQAAKQSHPDHCSEPDAANQFRAIQEAYEILSDPNKRAKYNAGLLLEASLGAVENVHSTHEWAAPLRCGYVMASGVKKLGRFVVDSILAWEDIQDADGRVLVTSWPMGVDHFVERWV